jgi:signal transduction histidine kinase/CheY-like chemotaxis protein
MSLRLLTVSLALEEDIVLVRQRTRQIAAMLRFDALDQTRLATAVSEVARNACAYAAGGRVEYAVVGVTAPQLYEICVSDRGGGIKNLQDVLEGQYRSGTGMGIGLVGARRLVDQFDIQTSGAGTVVWLRKLLPARSPVLTPAQLKALAHRLAAERPRGPLEEIREQNQELLAALGELRQRQEDLERLNRELEDTNRGVVALYAELDEKAEHLHKADELKSRFLSNMTHEFRTPVNSILALCNLILDRQDEPVETTTEVQFIKKAAQELSELVNDLLDLAKVEAGKIVVRPAEFEVGDVFAALRGMLRPLLINQSLNLVFEDPAGLPRMNSDESKVSQILRNFISNALKYTERGEVRVSARLAPEEEALVFSVADTGIGIAPADQERIFEEFSQLESPLHRTVRGTGLGLPLSRRLAGLLGGRIWLTSEVGVGSTFFAAIPVEYRPPASAPEEPLKWEVDPQRIPIVIVEDNFEDLLVYEQILKDTAFQPFAVRRLEHAEVAVERVKPRAVILDLVFGEQTAWSYLAKLKQEPATRRIPVLVASNFEDQRKALALGADIYRMKPVGREWLLETLTRMTARGEAATLLVVDDQPVSRYILKQILGDEPWTVLEAGSGEEGLARAAADAPDLVLLDLMLPDIDGTAGTGDREAAGHHGHVQAPRAARAGFARVPGVRGGVKGPAHEGHARAPRRTRARARPVGEPLPAAGARVTAARPAFRLPVLSGARRRAPPALRLLALSKRSESSFGRLRTTLRQGEGSNGRPPPPLSGRQRMYPRLRSRSIASRSSGASPPVARGMVRRP